MTTIEHDARAERCAAAPVNIPEALLNMANDESLLAEVIHVFFRTIPDMLESVRRAVDETQLEALSVQAHGIKGAAANICAKPLQEAACRLEHLADEKDAERLSQALHELERCAREFLAFAEQYQGRQGD